MFSSASFKTLLLLLGADMRRAGEVDEPQIWGVSSRTRLRLLTICTQSCGSPCTISAEERGRLATQSEKSIWDTQACEIHLKNSDRCLDRGTRVIEPELRWPVFLLNPRCSCSHSGVCSIIVRKTIVTLYLYSGNGLTKQYQTQNEPYTNGK